MATSSVASLPFVSVSKMRCDCQAYGPLFAAEIRSNSTTSSVCTSNEYYSSIKSHSTHSCITAYYTSFDGYDLDVVKGKHKGKSGTLLKVTPQKVHVQLDGEDKPCYLNHDSIELRRYGPQTVSSDSLLAENAKSVPKSLPEQILIDSNNSNIDILSNTSNELVSGVTVHIVKGKHKGKNGRFIKRTQRKVQVHVDGNENASYLDPDNIEIRSSAGQALYTEWLSTPQSEFTADTYISEETTVDSRYGNHDTTTRNDIHGKTLQSVDSLLTAHGYSSGPIVDIVNGKYKGRTGRLLKRTPHKIYVHIDGNDKPCYLDPTNIKLRSNVLPTLGSDRVDSEAPTGRAEETLSEGEFIGSEICQIDNPKSHDTNPASSLTDSPLRATACVVAGDTMVDIVHGKYTGKVGRFIKQTNQKVQVRVDGNEKPCYLNPEFVRFREGVVHSENSESYACKKLSSNGWSKSEPESLRNFVSHFFGDRLRKFTSIWPVTSVPTEQVQENGDRYLLLLVKARWKAKPKRIDAYYVLAPGPTMTLQNELENIAGFGFLPPNKVAPRLPLLFTPSARSENGLDLFFDDCSEDWFEIIPEGANEGCGFIPSNLIRRFTRAVGHNEPIFALQVRIYSSTLGIFKGVLFEKQGITKIQLPTSMQKVPPARRVGTGKVTFLVNNVFPSKRNQEISQVLQGTNLSVKLKRRNVKDDDDEMFRMNLVARGVPECIVNMYYERIQCYGEIGHCSLVGLADPTNCIPAGSVFITGINNTPCIGSEVFVTRFPCTNDGMKLNVVKEKPYLMSDGQYDWLRGLSFGGIVFGNPVNGSKPVPTTIANGDLDGDTYAVCWNKDILEFVKSSSDQSCTLKPRGPACCAWNDSWFDSGQRDMSDVQGASLHNDLVCKLCSEWKKSCIENGAQSNLTRFIGIAYKVSLEQQKHGGKVPVPAIVLASFPARLKPLLEAV